MSIVKNILALIIRKKKNDAVCVFESAVPELSGLGSDGKTSPIIGEFVSSDDFSFLPYFRITNATNLTLHNIDITFDDFVSIKTMVINSLAPKPVIHIGIVQILQQPMKQASQHYLVDFVMEMDFKSLVFACFLWSHTEKDALNSYNIVMTNEYAYAYLSYSNNSQGFSVRCVRD